MKQCWLPDVARVEFDMSLQMSSRVQPEGEDGLYVGEMEEEEVVRLLVCEVVEPKSPVVPRYVIPVAMYLGLMRLQRAA